MFEEFQDRLRRLAMMGEITTYGEIGNAMGLSISDPIQGQRLYDMLTASAVLDHEADRPWLCAVVVRSGDGIPGGGFFKTAQGLGLFAGGDQQARRRFWEEQVQALYAYWRGLS